MLGTIRDYETGELLGTFEYEDGGAGTSRRALLDREGNEGGGVEKKTFNMDRCEDRDAFDVTVRALAREKGIDYSRASALLADRVSFGPRPRVIDTDDPAVRAALAAETRKRCELSREESIRAHGDTHEAIDFSAMLERVCADLQSGKSIAGIEPKETS